MAYTDVQICNMALGHIGVSEEIANLTTEDSLAANKCNLFYTQAVESNLEKFAWPEATKYATLGLVEDFSAVTTPHDWDFSYRYPSDCLMARRIVTVLGRVDPNPAPYKVGGDDTGRLIYTDEEDAVLEYTKRLTDPNFFSALMAEAISWRLAAFLAPSLSRSKGIQQTAFATWLAVVSQAQVKSANEQQHPIPPESDFIRARD